MSVTGDPSGERRRRPARTVARRGAALALALPLATFGAFVADGAWRGDRVQRGVYLAEVELSGAEAARVTEVVQALAQRVAARPVVVRAAGAERSFMAREVGRALDVEATALAIGRVGRTGSVWIRWLGWLERWARPERVPPVLALDDAAAERALRLFSEETLPGQPVEGAVVVGATGPEVRSPASGHRLDLAAALTVAREGWVALEPAPLTLPLVPAAPRSTPATVEAALARSRVLLGGPVTLVDPVTGYELTLSPAQLGAALESTVEADGALRLGLDGGRLEPALSAARAALERPPEDARFRVEGDRLALIPARRGSALSPRAVARAALEAAAAPARVGVLPVIATAHPAFDTAAAEALGIRGLVARFTTHFPCCQPRVENIRRAAALVTGRVVPPGETLSLNQVIGERTARNGFVPAPTIEEGEMRDSPGGGVSQFATTFFNAVFRGGYDVIERQAHTYWFPRYPEGIEATLSWPKPDVVFRNDTAAGVLVHAEVVDTAVTVRLFGDTGGRKVKWDVSPRHDLVRPVTEYIPDPEQDPEREKVREGGVMGWTVTVRRRVTFADGTEREDKRKIVYKMRPRRVALHPCKIPEGEPDHTGEPCPEPEEPEEPGGSDGTP